VDSLERIRAGLAAVTGRTVKVVTRAKWNSRLRDGGKPTRLPEPFGPFLGVQGSPGFEVAVASGAPFAPVAGIHHVRRDENDPPDERYNTDSLDVVEDLVADSRWPEVLRAAGMATSPELEALVRAQVFAFPNQRPDHHSSAIPDDIAAAKPKGDTA
jgi:hypothetical protein